MQDSSAFQFIAIDQIHESTTNPRRTFDAAKLCELAESLKQSGMIQPITVRPDKQGFEIVAGARRYRAAHIAELFSVPARIVEIDDAQALEWQLVENSQRVDVHPYEEAQGFQRLLEVPGYDVATLVEKSGKSASHVYARLSLLQLIPVVAEAFIQERITASHANLISRLPQEGQAEAFEQCWRKDWQDNEPHLLPAKYLAAWIQANLYLPLADAPFDREDPNLNPGAGACVTCPRRSGHHTSLFCDVQGDQCLDSTCYHVKVEKFLDREIAAHPGLVQIENGWRNPKEQRPGAVQRGQVRKIETVIDNPDSEPAMPCEDAKTAIVVYGKQLGRKLTVCTDSHCPVHNPKVEADLDSAHASTAKGQTAESAVRRADFERKQAEIQAERSSMAEAYKARQVTFERILKDAPLTFNAAQIRLLLRALVGLDPYTFIEDAAEAFAHNDENDVDAEEILLAALSETPDDGLAGFVLRVVLAGYVGIRAKGEFDLLAEAERAFLPAEKEKPGKPKKAAKKTVPASRKKPAAKNKVAA